MPVEEFVEERLDAVKIPVFGSASFEFHLSLTLISPVPIKAHNDAWVSIIKWKNVVIRHATSRPRGFKEGSVWRAKIT